MIFLMFYTFLIQISMKKANNYVDLTKYVNNNNQILRAQFISLYNLNGIDDIFKNLTEIYLDDNLIEIVENKFFN